MEDLLLRRRNLLMTSTSSSASGVELYDYLQQDGSTYFDTGVSIAKNAQVLASFYAGNMISPVIVGSDYISPSSGNNWFLLMFTKPVSSGLQLQAQTQLSSGTAVAYAYKQVFYSNAYIKASVQGNASSYSSMLRYNAESLEGAVLIDVEPNELNSVSRGKSYNGSINTDAAKLWIFGTNDVTYGPRTAEVGSSSAGAKLYYLKVYESGIITHYYKPAIKDGIIGLYDTATKTFISPTAGSPTVGNI